MSLDTVNVPGVAEPVTVDKTASGDVFQLVKLDVGASGASSPVTAANPMPVALDASQLTALEPLSAVSIDNLPADPPTQTTLAAVLAKLIAAPATSALQGTIVSALSSIDSRLAGPLDTAAPAGGSTVAAQDTGNTTLASILAKLIASPATETTTAAILAKLIASPATAANQSTANTSLAAIDSKLGGTLTVTAAAGGATETTLAAVLAKLIAAPSTAANQDTGNASLASIDTKVSGNLTDQQLRATAVPVSLPAGSTTQPLGSDPGMVTREAPSDTWRASFTDTGSGVPSPLLTLLQTGSGQTVNQASSNLVITSGTTANAETLIQSVRSFKGAFQLRWKITLSQRIANNNFSIELADVIGSALAVTVNSATSVTVTFPTTNPFTALNVGQFVNLSRIAGVAGIPGRFAIASVSGLTVNFTVAGWPGSGSGTLMLWGWNYFRNLYTGISTTSMNFDAQRRGWASGDTVAAVDSTGGVGQVGMVQGAANFAGFFQTGPGNTNLYSMSARASRIENIPDDDTELFIIVRALNGTTNPASNTTATIGFVAVELTSYRKVFIAGADQNGATSALSVYVTNTIATNSTAAPSTFLMGDVSMQYRAGVTGAASGAHLISAATTNATILKSTAGKIVGYDLANTTAAWKYVKFHNQTTTPTAGTGVVRTVGVPPNGKAALSLPGGIAFLTGIGMTVTGAYADADATAVAAGDVIGDIYFA